jgi:hypothetical protein
VTALEENPGLHDEKSETNHLSSYLALTDSVGTRTYLALTESAGIRIYLALTDSAGTRTYLALTDSACIQTSHYLLT